MQLRTVVSYGDRIHIGQYIEIATPPSAVRNDTCGGELLLHREIIVSQPIMCCSAKDDAKRGGAMPLPCYVFTDLPW